jgi:hypothetical protein
MIDALIRMPAVKRLMSSVLLAGGVLLVFTGMSASLGFTVPGVAAAVTAIAALLYAGSVWFGAPPAIPLPAGSQTVLVFDRDLRVTAGPGTGGSVTQQFPVALRPEVEARCRAALRGESTHFTCTLGGLRVVCDAAPVLNAAGAVLYGILVIGSGLSAPVVSPDPVATVA